MKNIHIALATTALMTSLLTGTALAHSVSGNSMMSDDAMMGPGMMGDYSEDQWNRFDRSFRDMSQLMDRIHQADNPEEHDRLMHEHMHQLQDGMMMGEGWRAGTPDASMSPGDWDDRMRSMEQHMFLMQQMLNQMIEHEAVENEGDTE